VPTLLDKGSFLIDNGTNSINTSKIIMVPFNHIFNATPTNINYTVISSGSYRFDVVIIKIFSHGFQVNVTRKYNHSGHPKLVKLNWTLLSGEIAHNTNAGGKCMRSFLKIQGIPFIYLLSAITQIIIFLKHIVKELL